MTALPLINQTGKPAGVAGKSRDDLDLYSGTNPIFLTDAGVGGGPYAWSIVDQPPGATASLTTPTLASTQLTGASVAGSYDIQLVKAGGASPGDIYRVICGFQLALPSWAASSGLRIPAFGETTEFNVQSSPGAGANPRGWAEEMDAWFRSLASFAFGVAIQDSGSGVGTEPFYTINFTGSSVTSVVDAGSGVVTVTIGSASAIDFQNNGANLADNPYPGINTLTPDPPALTGESLFLDQNAHFVPNGPGTNVGLRVTAAAHQTSHHGSGIVEANATLKAALKGTINNVPNPMTWSFAAMASGDVAVAQGRLIPGALYPGTTAFSLPAATQRDLYDIGVNPQTGAIFATSLAACLTTNTPFIVLDISATHPTGAFNLIVSGNTVSWAGGVPASWSVAPLNGYLRLYHQNGVDWVDVWMYQAPGGAGTDIWTVASAGVTNALILARAPYWPDPIAVQSRWGTGTSHYYRDMRRFDYAPNVQLQPQSYQQLDTQGLDRRLDAAVVFTHRQPWSDITQPSSYGSFGLFHVNGDLDASRVEGGEFWVGGRRYIYTTSYTFSTSGITNADVLVAAKVNANGIVSIVVLLAADPLVALVNNLYTGTLSTLEGPQPMRDLICPLYWGHLDGSSILLGAKRVDLRRDASQLGSWTVGGRTYQAELGNVRLPLRPARATMPMGDAVAEYDSLSAALAYHGAWTGSDNLTSGNAVNAPPVALRVVGNVWERYTVTLWRNVTIRGFGQPIILLDEPTDGLDGFFRVGGFVSEVGSGAHAVYSIELYDLTFVVRAVSAPYAANGSLLAIKAPTWDTTDPVYAAHLPTASCQCLTLHGLLFQVEDTTNISQTTGLHTIRMTGESSGGAPIESGFFFDITVRNCSNVPFSTPNTGNAEPMFNTFFSIRGASKEVISQSASLILVENNFQYVWNVGSEFLSDDGEVGICVRANWIVIGATTGVGVGVKIATGSPGFFPEVSYNRILYSVATGAGPAGISIQSATLASVFGNELFAIVGGTGSEKTGILFGGDAASGAYVRSNRVQGFRTGISVIDESVAVSDMDISDNLVLTGANSPDDSSIGILLGTNIPADFNRVRVYNNRVLFARTGIMLRRISDNSADIVVSGNVISGQRNTSATPSGTFGARGIVVRFHTAPAIPANVSICNNQIRDFLGIGAADFPEAYPNCGILVANVATTTHTRGLIVANNWMQAYSDGAPVDYTYAVAGIALVGAWDSAVVDNNVVCNEVVRTNAPTSGILCDATVFSTAPDTLVGPQITGNHILWLSATVAASTSFDDSAGVLLRGPQYGARVDGNHIGVQSTMATGDTAGGLIHNVLLASDMRNVSVDGNTLSTETVHASITTNGANGCAVWCPGSMFNVRVCNNNINGAWMRNPNVGVAATEPTGWGIISIGDAGSRSGYGISVSGNNIKQAVFGSSFGGDLVPNGIRIGSDTVGNGDSIDLQQIQVCMNVISADLNSENSVNYSAGIAIISLKNSGDAAGMLNVVVQGNMVTRADQAAVPVSMGIHCRGANWCTFSDNRVVPFDGTVLDIADFAVTGSVQQNRWMDNVFGNDSTTGAYQLDAGVYRASPAPDNWDGAAYV